MVDHCTAQVPAEFQEGSLTAENQMRLAGIHRNSKSVHLPATLELEWLELADFDQQATLVGMVA